MRVTSLSLAALGLVGSVVAHPFGETEAVLGRQSQSQQKANAVKEAFQHAWNGYMKYAFPHDELHPVSNGYGDSR
jgi:mannosyl-oligosaccharide alpha-1,2-mannosidase